MNSRNTSVMRSMSTNSSMQGWHSGHDRSKRSNISLIPKMWADWTVYPANVHLVKTGWPLSRHCEIPWRFAAVFRDTCKGLKIRFEDFWRTSCTNLKDCQNSTKMQNCTVHTCLQKYALYKRSSSAVTKWPRDASCLSVVSFNSTKRWVQSYIVSYVLRRRQIYHRIQLNAVLLSSA